MTAKVLAQALADVIAEFYRAKDIYPPMNSAHEGWAVLREEVDELWDEIKAKECTRNHDRLRKEAVQVAAVAVRFVIDVCDSKGGGTK